MIHSMTGYTAQTYGIAGASLHLELRSVNSRYLDLSFRIGDDLRIVEPLLREHLTARLNRGKLECRLHLVPAHGAASQTAVSNEVLGQLSALQQTVLARMPNAAPLSVAEILRWPGMLGDNTLSTEEIQSACATLIALALDDFLASRAREGEKLATMILERVARMRDLVAQTAPRLPEVLQDYREKLTTKLREALSSADEERIRTEVGLFAARIDVAEELSRLTTHLDEVERVLKKGGAAGKRLDFLMQELNREANTLASKSVSSDITAVALELKLLIEQMREQVQNIE